MYVTSDRQERALIQTAIIDAQELRAQYMAETFKSLFRLVKKGFVSLNEALHHDKQTGDCGHAA